MHHCHLDVRYTVGHFCCRCSCWCLASAVGNSIVRIIGNIGSICCHTPLIILGFCLAFACLADALPFIFGGRRVPPRSSSLGSSSVVPAVAACRQETEEMGESHNENSKIHNTRDMPRILVIIYIRRPMQSQDSCVGYVRSFGNATRPGETDGEFWSLVGRWNDCAPVVV